MEISLAVPSSITIPDVVWYVFWVCIFVIALYGIYRIFVPRQPDDWLHEH
jgi:hypothetical protein